MQIKSFLVLLFFFLNSEVLSVTSDDYLCKNLERAYKYCDSLEGVSNHCRTGLRQEIVDRMCTKKGLGSGHCYELVAPNTHDGVCMCACSCVSGDTKILMADKTFKLAKEISIGDKVYAPYLPDNTAEVNFVTVNHVTNYSVVKIILPNDQMQVSDNHLFITPGLKVVEAYNLKKHDVILDNVGAEVEIIDIEKNYPFAGGLYNFFLNENQEDPKSHILVTGEAKVQSGDYLIQAHNDESKIGTLNDDIKIKTVE